MARNGRRRIINRDGVDVENLLGTSCVFARCAHLAAHRAAANIFLFRTRATLRGIAGFAALCAHALYNNADMVQRQQVGGCWQAGQQHIARVSIS